MAAVIQTGEIAGITAPVGKFPKPTITGTAQAEVKWNATASVYEIPFLQATAIDISDQVMLDYYNAIAAGLSAMKATDFTSIKDHLNNTGFDPKVVLNYFVAFYMSYPAVGAPGQLTRHDITMQLVIIIMFAMVRGINFTAALNTTLDSGKNMVNKAIAILTPVFVNQKGANVDKTKLTPGRLFSVFPRVCATVAMAIPTKYGAQKPYPEFPNILCWPGSTSVVPHKFQNLMEACTLFQINLDNLFSQKQAQPQSYDEAVKKQDKAIKFAQLSHDNSLSSEEMREGLMRAVKIEADIPARPDGYLDVDEDDWPEVNQRGRGSRRAAPAVVTTTTTSDVGSSSSGGSSSRKGRK